MASEEKKPKKRSAGASEKKPKKGPPPLESAKKGSSATATAEQESGKTRKDGKSADKAAKKSAERDGKEVKKRKVILPGQQVVEEPEEEAPRRLHRIVQTLGACLVSTLLHVIIIVALGLWMMPEVARSTLVPLTVNPLSEPEEPLDTVRLDQSLEASSTMSFATASSSPDVGAEAPEVEDPALDAEVLDADASNTGVDVGELVTNTPSSRSILKEVPDGALGTKRSVVGGYGQAIDQITRRIMWMLSKNKVLVIWLFDESESMKDDQQDIRGRVERVYKELGLSERASSEALLTAIASFGEDFQVLTKKPTNDLDDIRAAIDNIPNDPSGKENVFKAVGQAVNLYSKFANRGKRRMALILVTDESGEWDDATQYLEPAIAEVKSARCTVFTLGREAVFGYPYAHLRWVHPQTGRPHWLKMNRGPETAFIEQVQTNGFHRRYDAYPSGYGPYELSRLAHQSGGVYFLLPSKESNLVRSSDRKYELDAMRGYSPDLRARAEIIKDRDKSKLRTTIWKIINDLNPYNEQKAQVVELRIHFSKEFPEFVKQVEKEKAKSRIYLAYLQQAEKVLGDLRRLRQEEESPRWQGNYDLVYGQIVAFQVRVQEYVTYLDQFVKKPEKIPLTKSPNLSLIYLDINTRKKQLLEEETAEKVKKATDLFKQCIKNHPGTPYASRAKWELRRGFGVYLHGYYEPPYKKVKNPLPLPKL